MPFLLVGVYLVLLVLLAEGLRRLPPRLGLALWALVPLALLPWWLRLAAEVGETWTVFLWVKTASVVAANLWLFTCRWRGERLRPAAVAWPLYLFLVLNMVEAVAWDLTHGNPLNAAAGALLIALAPGWRAFSVAREAPRDVLYAAPRGWIVAYSVWNLAFVYANWGSALTGQHVAVLAAALLVAARTGWSRWIQARSVILGLHLVIFCSTYPWMRALFDASSWRDETALAVAPAVALAVAVAHALFTFFAGFTARRRATSAWRPNSPAP